MTKRGIGIVVVLVVLCLLSTEYVWSAVGCTLNDPDRDIKRIFPESTGYRTEFITIEEQGGKELLGEIEEKLGDTLDSVYETMDVPYAYYAVLKGKELIGRIHGVNQKGTYGGMQLILASDLEGKIIDFYYQKISSPEAKRFKDKQFTDDFRGLNLADFYDGSFLAEISDPSLNNHQDFLNTVRGIKKNLILLDVFKLGGRYDEYYEKRKEEKNEDAK